MELFIQGKGRVSLNQADFVAQGGEGAIYVKGDSAFKVYTDPTRMIPPAKIQELSALTLPNIVRPQELLLDTRNHPVGYTMRRVTDAVPLCQLFTRAFRERSGITPDIIIQLVQKLQAGVSHVHQKGMLVVDLNEMNFLVQILKREVLFIDVDSYQTPGSPPTAIMDSIRDRHSSQFSPDTDWFSFGIVSFQMFIGIHPFKGKHSTYTDLDSRMLHHVSVFNKEVNVPKVCYPFAVIPQAYLDWFRAVFEGGKRCPPPTDLRGVVIVAPVVQRIAGSDKLTIKELYRFPAEILMPVFAGATYTALTTGGLYVGDKKVAPGSGYKIGFAPRSHSMIAASIQGERIKLLDATRQCAIEADLAGEALTSSEGRLYAKNGGGLYEMEFVELPTGIKGSLKLVGNVLENATQVFEGVVIQSLLGAYYASLFPGPGVCYSIRIPELDGHQVIDAKFENKVLMAIGVKEGKYSKFILRLDDGFQIYDLRIVKDITYSGLNFVVLDNGICIQINENEEMEIFSNRKDASNLRVVSDPAIAGARLFKNGTQVIFARGDTLYSVSLKS